MTIVKSYWHNFTQSAYFITLFVSFISYGPTDLSLLNEFLKNFSFEDFQNFQEIGAQILSKLVISAPSKPSRSSGSWINISLYIYCCSTFSLVFPGFYAVEANDFKKAVSSLYPMGIQFCFPFGRDMFLNEHSQFHMFVYVLTDMTLIRMSTVCISAQMRMRICVCS